MNVNAQVARLLGELATLTELDEADPASFRVRAYTNAQRTVVTLDDDVAQLSAGQLAKIKGIGKSTAAKIREYVETGSIAKLDELRAKHPPEKIALLKIPGLGPKSVQALNAQLGIADLPSLLAALDSGEVAKLEGFGDKTVTKIREAITALDLDSKQHRVPIGDALDVAQLLVEGLAALDGVGRVAWAGSLRRFVDTVGDLDIVVESESPVSIDIIRRYVDVGRVIGEGDTKTSFATRTGLQVDIRTVSSRSFGSALVYFTGSKAHNIRLRQLAQQRGLTLNEYGFASVDAADNEAETSTRLDVTRVTERTAETEEAVYATLDLAWIPPELREDHGEIEHAQAHGTFDLVSVADLCGDLHVHTDLSGDGRMTLDELVEAAACRGLAYVAITDHAENLTMNGVSREDMLAQREQLRDLEQRRGDIRLFHGAELNIGVDGDLDYDDEFLRGFDWLVASVHSHLDRDSQTQTLRIIRAMEHPSVTAIGHLTTRKIGSRPPIDVDAEAIFDAAVRTGTAIEINASLSRLDPPEEMLRLALRLGVTFVLSTDAHAVADFERATFGVSHARRAGVPASPIANTRPLDDFTDWLHNLQS